jgi:hypothetical protein
MRVCSWQRGGNIALGFPARHPGTLSCDKSKDLRDMRRVAKRNVNDLRSISTAMVDAARDSLVIGLG